jgi:hypothetical protein
MVKTFRDLLIKEKANMAANSTMKVKCDISLEEDRPA